MLKCTRVHIRFFITPKVLETSSTSTEVVGNFRISLLEAAPTFINRPIKTEAVQLAVMKSKSEQGSSCSVQCLGRGSRSAVRISGEALSWPTGEMLDVLLE